MAVQAPLSLVCRSPGSGSVVHPLLWFAVWPAIGISLVATAVLLLLTLVVPRFAEIRILLMLTSITVFMGALSLDWLFQGLERMKRVAAVGILGQGVYTLGVLLFVKTQAHILRVPLASAAGAAVASGTLGVVAWRARHPVAIVLGRWAGVCGLTRIAAKPTQRPSTWPPTRST